MNLRTVIVGLSGGVDSALTAQLLLEQGYSVEGLFMFNWAEDEDAYCTAAEDFAMAQSVAAQLGIPLHRADFSTQYRDRVFAHFLDEYRAGRTPSPDLLCNREIKFGEFLRYAEDLGAGAIATGHYARIEHLENRSRLLLAADQSKDQTYFLASVPAAALRRTLFPLGGLHKDEVRRLARHRGLPNHQRKDSTGICSVGERPMREFLSRYLSTQPGPIVDTAGRVLGEHPGLCFYTIGQRRGLGIGGQAGAREAPWFVCAKDSATATLTVTQDREHPSLRCRHAELETPLWIHAPPPLPWQGRVRIRHRQALQEAALRLEDGRWLLRFDQPQWAIAAGQYAVLYAGDECLGCAVIAAARPEATDANPV